MQLAWFSQKTEPAKSDQLLQAAGGVRIYARLMKKLEVARRDQRLERTVTNEQALQVGWDIYCYGNLTVYLPPQCHPHPCKWGHIKELLTTIVPEIKALIRALFQGDCGIGRGYP